MLPWIRSPAIRQIYTPQVDNFSSVCPVRWKNVSNVAGTQMLERTWQNLQGFLPKPMCPKYKDKGQSKMLPSVPEYIMYVYIYIYTYNIYIYTYNIYICIDGVGDKALEQQHPRIF